MSAPEVCATCKVREVGLSKGEARLIGHILTEGQFARGVSKREGDLKRVASVVLERFESSPQVRDASLGCIDAHIDGSCQFIQDDPENINDNNH